MTLPDLTYVGHATVLIEAGGARVLTDPVLTSRLGFLRRVVGDPDPADHADVDLVLLSHLHHDHLHLPSLRRVGRHVRVVAPRGAGALLRRHGHLDVEEVAPGDVVRHGPLIVTATPAAHDERRWPLSGPRAVPVGYLVEYESTTTYFAGDTDLFPEMGSLRPDVALLPVWGWGTDVGVGHLDPGRAAEAAERLEARYAVPIHWGTLFPHSLHRLLPRLARHLEEPPHAFARHVAARGCAAIVVVTPPGGRVELPAAPTTGTAPAARAVPP